MPWTHGWQRVIVHALVAHLLSASASSSASRGSIPIHSTGVPNARMTLPPLAVTANRSWPSSSGVRAPWVNLPVSPSGVPWARVSAFIAPIVSTTFACCSASLNHRSPRCSSFCIMVSVRPHLPERLLGHNRQCRGHHVSRRPLVHPHTRCPRFSCPFDVDRSQSDSRGTNMYAHILMLSTEPRLGEFSGAHRLFFPRGRRRAQLAGRSTDGRDESR